MLIERFILNVINTERKILTHHEIIDRIAEQIELLSFMYARNQNCGFIQASGSQVSHLLIHLSSLNFVLHTY